MNKPKIIKFYSNTCGPCKVLDNFLKKANIEYEAIDVFDEKNTPIVTQYNIRSVPVLIKEEDGKEIARHVGIMTEEQLKEWCK